MVFLEGKREMLERFLTTAYLAAMACHPNATIRCFRPKSKSSKLSREKKQPSKSTNKNDIFRSNSSLSRCSVSSNMNITPSPPNISPPRNDRNSSRNGRDSYVVSTLVEEEPSFGVVETIFRSGWDTNIGLVIEKVLKINHNVDVLDKFEEYREIVKSKSTKNIPGDSMRIERLAVDGNEFLRFYGATVTCSLGNNKLSSICHRECCGICQMIGSSLSHGEEPVALSKNSRQAHDKVETECVVNQICCARKAVVICRVIAGRVARCRGDDGLVDGQEGGFDSVVSVSNSEELTVLNARAVLPCFVVVYDVQS
ncbi:hypothetical protein PTKIN_Ptkin13bG0271300 [Pterospermum kingtungense]